MYIFVLVVFKILLLSPGKAYIYGYETETISPTVITYEKPRTTVSVGNTETWNGTSWTEVNDVNTARRNLGSAGTNTEALGFGGLTISFPTAVNVGNTEVWNGSSWTEVNDLNTARRLLAGSGTQAAALAFGGFTTVSVGSTEEFNGTPTKILKTEGQNLKIFMVQIFKY